MENNTYFVATYEPVVAAWLRPEVADGKKIVWVEIARNVVEALTDTEAAEIILGALPELSKNVKSVLGKAHTDGVKGYKISATKMEKQRFDTWGIPQELESEQLY